MAKGKVSPELIEQFKQIVGEKYVYTDKDKLEPYSHDEVTDPHYMKEPQVVVLPATTEEVSKVVKLCYDNDTVMVPRAAGTGLAAGVAAGEPHPEEDPGCVVSGRAPDGDLRPVLCHILRYGQRPGVRVHFYLHVFCGGCGGPVVHRRRYCRGACFLYPLGGGYDQALHERSFHCGF